ncbi:MAG: NAD(P)-dependent oxidoreductase [Anaerolineales bacterium]|jgi:D-3-phosphoglycerate dehydrogenase
MRILLAEKSSFSARGVQALSALAPTDALDLGQDELRAAIKDYDILVVRLGLHVDKSVLVAGEHIQVVGTPTTGLDHIDLKAAQKRNVTVLSLKGERAFLDEIYATAEHTFALLLSLIRRIPFAFQAVKDYTWRRDLYRGTELYGKVLGIVGFGRLGRMVYKYGLAFGMKVLVYDLYQRTLPDGVKACASLEDLLVSSDVISLHVPLNADTEGMFSDEQFALIRPGSVLINTSRGAIIDEAALLRALQSKSLAGAALDVLCDEHHLDRDNANPLIEYARDHANLIITPHIGGATQESVEKADLFLANKIADFLKP